MHTLDKREKARRSYKDEKVQAVVSHGRGSEFPLDYLLRNVGQLKNTSFFDKQRGLTLNAFTDTSSLKVR